MLHSSSAETGECHCAGGKANPCPCWRRGDCVTGATGFAVFHWRLSGPLGGDNRGFWSNSDLSKTPAKQAEATSSGRSADVLLEWQ